MTIIMCSIPMLQILFFILYINPDLFFLAIIVDLAWYFVVIGWIILCINFTNKLSEFFEKN